MSQPTVNRCASSVATPNLPQRVLDALPEAAFVFDSCSAMLRPVNLRAQQMLPAGWQNTDEIRAEEVFPEFSHAVLEQTVTGPVFSRMRDITSGAIHEVAISRLPLVEPSGNVAAGHTWVILAKLLTDPLSDNGLLPRDALDDAYHDPLTRLPNRRMFQRRLERAFERTTRGEYHFAVLFVDLDDFKDVNDRFGHLEGDKVLIVAAQRMLESVRPQDMVARRDGDEFTILLDDLAEPSDALHVAERMVNHLRAPIAIEGHSSNLASIGASVGIAMAGRSAADADSLLARADAAMYRAKAAGGGVWIVPDDAGGDEQLVGRRQKPVPR